VNDTDPPVGAVPNATPLTLVRTSIAIVPSWQDRHAPDRLAWIAADVAVTLLVELLYGWYDVVGVARFQRGIVFEPPCGTWQNTQVWVLMVVFVFRSAEPVLKSCGPPAIVDVFCAYPMPESISSATPASNPVRLISSLR
jgi:hypothetical protein